MKAIFSGGGTGGHIFPAIAVANELKSRDKSAEILFVGALGKMEMEKIPKAGFSIKGLWISGFQRRLTLSNLLFPVKVITSLIQAYFIVRKFKPDVAIGFGGFASGPALWISGKLGIPMILQEQNSYPGVTNRILGKDADRICLGSEAAARYFPQSVIEVTGNPVRKLETSQLTKESSSDHFGLQSGLKTVLIIGGSLGARTFNVALRDSFEDISNMSDVQFLWQCGALYYDEYKNCKTASLDNVSITPFIDRMDMAYKAADLVISRAGALSVTELCVQAKASILVPSPNVAEDHQTKNAMALVDKEACLMLKDEELSQVFSSTVKTTLQDEPLMKKLMANIAQLAKPEATKRITDVLMQLGQKSEKH